MAESNRNYSVSEKQLRLCETIKDNIPDNIDIYNSCVDTMTDIDNFIYDTEQLLTKNNKEIKLLKTEIVDKNLLVVEQAKLLDGYCSHAFDQLELIDRQQDIIDKYRSSCVIS